MTRPAIVFLSAVLLGCASISSSLAEPAKTTPSAVSASIDAKLATGPEGTYSRTCGYCHGANVGPILLGKGYPPEAITYMVRNGRGAMPAFRPSEISQTELQALSMWLSTSAPSAADSGN